MTTFRVRCFKDGIWDEKPLVEVSADSPKEAANLACGGPLRGGTGTVHELRAHVWQDMKEDPDRLTKPEFLFFADVPGAKQN